MGKILIITGLSGAGKTQALKSAEDLGYYSIDNILVDMLEKFVEITKESKINKVAIGIDIRQEADFDDLKNILSKWKKEKKDYKILYLEATKKTLIQRYKMTKRKHPLENKYNLQDAIEMEHYKTIWLKKAANYVINTDDYTNYDLKNKLEEVLKNKVAWKMDVDILSFGYKYGIPNDADMVFDVRFLINPYYEEKLRKLYGDDKKIINYIEKDSITKEAVEKLENLILYLLPLYKEEGKSKIVFAFGCTGGKHRSIYVATKMAKIIKEKKLYNVNLEHRDRLR